MVNFDKLEKSVDDACRTIDSLRERRKDLLEALKTVADDIEDFLVDANSGLKPDLIRLEKANIKARAIIAAAEGV